ncbi:hypothetical protein Tco_0951092 [Tanacetum coccineum]|uniref:Transposase (putative) gypsy type domain-containing protein n=1 Tax=Tanacetum coccineum TaxID=301880 RepID=A0ABQ5DVJ1_9ASTR
MHNRRNCMWGPTADPLNEKRRKRLSDGTGGPQTASPSSQSQTIQKVSGGHMASIQRGTSVEDIPHTLLISTEFHHHREYLLEFTSEYGIPEDLHLELPGLEDTIVDFPKGKVGVYTKFFEFASYRIPLSQFLFDILGYYQIHLSQLSVIGTSKVGHFEITCRVLNIIPTLNLFRMFYIPSYNSGWMSFSKRSGKNSPQCYTKALDSLKNWNNHFFWVDEKVFPTVVAWRTGAPKDEMPPADSYSTTEGLVQDDRSQEISSAGQATTDEVAPEAGQEEEVAVIGPPMTKRSSKGTAIEIPTKDVATTDVNVQFSVGSHESGRSTSVPSIVGSPSNFLSHYNMNLARQVAMGSELRLRFEQEVRLLKKARAKISRRDQRIQVREEEIKKLDQEFKSLRATEMEVHGLRNQTKNLETLLEAEADMKKAAKAKNTKLTKELESLRVRFADLQAAFEEFKKYEDARVEQWCAEKDARLDALSIDFDEEWYPHMLTAIAGRQWVIGHGIRLVVMKCAELTELRQVFANVVSAGIAKGMSEGLKYGIEHGKAGRDLVDVEAYDPEANDKLVKALQDLKDLKYPMVG